MSFDAKRKERITGTIHAENAAFHVKERFFFFSSLFFFFRGTSQINDRFCRVNWRGIYTCVMYTSEEDVL